MKPFKQIDIKSIVSQIRTEGVSMRRRFAVYVISATALVLSVILFMLNLFGVMNPTNDQIMDVLDTQLLSYADNIEHDYDRLAAYAISFSEQLENEIQNYLTENNLTFEDLKNDADALSGLQSELYRTVYLNMQLAPSSGAFYILDTTVSSKVDTDFYNGIYLKYINLYSENTVNNDIALYRGSYDTGKNNNLIFHSGWNNEMRTDFFCSCDAVFTKETHYILSPTVEIPDTWERARYVYVPIRDLKERIIGICGFEVNDLYFQLSEKATNSKLGLIVGALLDEKNGSYTGQFNSNRYNTANSGNVQVAVKEGSTVFDFGSERCVGITKSITLGNNTFVVALMIAEPQYDALIRQGQIKTIGIILFVVIFAFVICLVMSKKYVAPILKKIEQIKSSEDCGNRLNIREIDDLFAFLAEKDSIHEDQLRALEKAKQAAEEEAQRTKTAYEKALREYELTQDDSSKRGDIQFTEELLKEIPLDEYEYFISNLRTLTPRETLIYELYLEGKKAHEIAAIIGITENTMKFHNKNIYSKLGVSSRKQLLKLASLKRYYDRKENPSV